MRTREKFKFIAVQVSLTALALFLLAGPAFNQDRATFEKGKDLFAFYGCFACHGWEGKGGLLGDVLQNLQSLLSHFRLSYSHRNRRYPYSQIPCNLRQGNTHLSAQIMRDLSPYLRYLPPLTPPPDLLLFYSRLLTDIRPARWIKR